MWDVIVVGGGPAGAIAALAARRAAPAARVLLLDKARFPRDKACGDGIAPHALDELAALDVPDAAHGYAPIRTLRLRTPAGAQVTASPRRDNHVIPRRVFDARLVGPRCRRVWRSGRASARVAPDGLGRGAERRRAARASGGGRRRRELHGPPSPRRAGNPPGDLALAVCGYAPAPPGPPEQAIAFVAESWPVYVCSFAIGDGTANVAYGLLRRALHGGRGAAARPPGRAAARAAGGPRNAARPHLPFSSARPSPGHGRVLLAGDAASLINPLTGEGIYYAVASGRRAGEAAATDPARYGLAQVRALPGAHLRQTTVLSRAIRHPPLVEAAVRAAARHGGVFYDLVEIGLGAGRLRPSSATRVAAAYVRG